MLRDLESTNQTILNGEPIQQALLQSGDRVLLGDVLYIVELDETSTDQSARASEESSHHLLLADPKSDSEMPTTRLAVENVSSRGNEE